MEFSIFTIRNKSFSEIEFAGVIQIHFWDKYMIFPNIKMTHEVYKRTSQLVCANAHNTREKSE